ncbi:MtaA/CmuA family methyltransferase [Desulfosporosinus burensis]
MVSTEMTSKERFLAALLRQKVDRPSVANPTSVATMDSMRLTEAYFPHVHLNADKMAALAGAGHDLLGFDTVSPYFSVQQEAAAFGCKMTWGEIDTMPDSLGPLYKDPEQVKIPEDFLDKSPIKTVLEALKLLRGRYDKRCAIVGKAMGPWTLAYHLYGTEDFLCDSLLEPDKVRAFLDILKEVTILFANQQFACGADVVTIADHATGDLVGPCVYRDLLLPVHQEITARLEGPAILHICGKTLDRMGYIADSGFVNFHFDSKVDPVAAMEAVKGKISLSGNINNVETLLYGTPQMIEDEVKRIMAAGVQIIAPECAVPLRVSNTNLHAIVSSVCKLAKANSIG